MVSKLQSQISKSQARSLHASLTKEKLYYKFMENTIGMFLSTEKKKENVERQFLYKHFVPPQLLPQKKDNLVRLFPSFSFHRSV